MDGSIMSGAVRKQGKHICKVTKNWKNRGKITPFDSPEHRAVKRLCVLCVWTTMTVMMTRWILMWRIPVTNSYWWRTDTRWQLQTVTGCEKTVQRWSAGNWHGYCAACRRWLLTDPLIPLVWTVLYWRPDYDWILDNLTACGIGATGILWTNHNVNACTSIGLRLFNYTVCYTMYT